MQTKNSAYLDNKLKQLKELVLNKPSGYEIGEMSRASAANFPSSQKYVPTYTEKETLYSNYKPSGKVAFQAPTDSNMFSYNLGSPVGPSNGDRNNIYQGSKLQVSMTPNQNVHIETRRPHSTQIIENLKNSEANFNGIRAYPTFTQTQAQTVSANGMINPMEPKVKTVHASNTKSFIQQETSPFELRSTNFQMPQTNFGTDLSFRGQPTTNLKQTEFSIPGLRTTTMAQTQAYFPSERFVSTDVQDPRVLETLNQTTFIERNENKILSEMQNKISAHLEKNGKVGEEIMGLRRGLDVERARLMQLDEQLKDEFKHIKMSEAETVSGAQNLDAKLSEIIEKTAQDDEKHTRMRADLEKIQVENEMLRGELKRLGEITSEKILDLENNINSVARMKEFELENFNMEKDKVGNSADFVIEQMKVHFNDRSAKIEDQMRKIQLDKDKLATDLRGITDELKQYNFNADQKINNIMNQVIQEEQEKHQIEVKEIEGKLRTEEEEIARLNRRTQDLINKLQTTEREGKNRLMSKKNENTRLKEDLSNYEQNYNKLLIQVSNETRDYEKKKEMVELLKEDFDEVHNKSQMLDQRYEEEMNNIQAGHEETLQDIDANYNALRDREQKLMQEIRNEKDRIFELQKRHTELIDEVKRNFDATLSNQFPDKGK